MSASPVRIVASPLSEITPPAHSTVALQIERRLVLRIRSPEAVRTSTSLLSRHLVCFSLLSFGCAEVSPSEGTLGALAALALTCCGLLSVSLPSDLAASRWPAAALRRNPPVALVASPRWCNLSSVREERLLSGVKWWVDSDRLRPACVVTAILAVPPENVNLTPAGLPRRAFFSRVTALRDLLYPQRVA